MELNIPTKQEDKYLVLLTFLSAIKPFSELRKREIEVYAELVRYWNEYSSLTSKQRNKLIFDYDTRLAIAEKLETTVDNIHYISSGLKKKGLINNDGIIEKYADIIDVSKNYLKINLITQ